MLVIAVLIISGCKTNPKNSSVIDIQKETTKQDIIDIVSIVKNSFSPVLGISLSRTPKISFVTTDELKTHLNKHYSDKTPNHSSELHNFSQAVAAIYCTFDKSIYIIPSNVKLLESRAKKSSLTAYYSLLEIISHELIHALQDQQKLLNFPTKSAKQQLAFSTLIEGHAELQNALVLRNLNLVKDIYEYGTQKGIDITEDKEQLKYNKLFASKYINGKLIFNKTHKEYGNNGTWEALKNPQPLIKLIVNKL